MAQDPQKRISSSKKTIDDVVKALVKESFNSMYTGLPAKVLKFYPEEMRADVQPLLQTTDMFGVNQDSSPTTNIPVVFPHSEDIYIRCPLKAGDLVWVQYSTVALDDILESNKPTKPTSVRRFSQKDGMVLGGYRYDSGEKTLSGSTEDLVIHRRSTNTILKITSTGDVIVTGAKQVSVECQQAEVKATSDVAIKTPEILMDASEVVVTGNLSVQGNTDVAGMASVAQNLAVGGATTSTGSITGSKILTKSGKSLEDHTHEYVPGSGTPTQTGRPN